VILFASCGSAVDAVPCKTPPETAIEVLAGVHPWEKWGQCANLDKMPVTFRPRDDLFRSFISFAESLRSSAANSWLLPPQYQPRRK